ncbi:hypothetical protein L195_g061760, partial [Trifolium pratense]
MRLYVLQRVEVQILTIDSSDNNEFLQIDKSNFISLVVKLLTFLHSMEHQDILLCCFSVLSS